MTDSPKTSKAQRFVLGFVLGVLVIFGGLYMLDVLTHKGTVPRGVSVGGVSIGGMRPEEAVQKLDTQLHDIATKPVTVKAGELHSTFVPAEAGIEPNWEATVEGAGTDSLNPFTRLSGLVRKVELTPAARVDEQRFDAETERIAGELSREPVEPVVKWTDTFTVDPKPADGQQVQAKELSPELLDGWLEQEIQIEVDTEKPQLADAVEEARKTAETIAKPFTVHGKGKDATIPKDRLGEVLTFTPEGKKFKPEIHVDAAQAIFSEQLASTEQPKQNALISVNGGQRQITPHVDGVKINWEKTLADFPQRLQSEERELDAVYEDDPATFTTDMAKVATFDEVVGEFTTSGYSAASGINIARVSEMVTGAIVAPGDTFSLNGYTGPRGTAQGFVESGIILNGHADKAVGGGISQYATTLYNAAYFAGMTDVAHTAHSYYISRYPAGREATVFEGAIDLQFRNDSAYPVQIQSFVADGSVTVRLMGVKTVQVESVNGGRWAYTDPTPINLSGANCVPSQGAPGFTTSDTRIVRDLQGSEISRNTTTTVYDPSPIVRCG